MSRGADGPDGAVPPASSAAGASPTTPTARTPHATPPEPAGAPAAAEPTGAELPRADLPRAEPVDAELVGAGRAGAEPGGDHAGAEPAGAARAEGGPVGAEAEGSGPAEAAEVVAPAGSRRWLTAALLTVIAVALVAVGGAISVLTGVGRPYLPRTDSVDAGFARDMATHHEQAIHIAQVARDHSTDPSIRLIAYDIETGQLAQTGQMRGWLQSWGLSQQSGRTPMTWMGDAAGTHEHTAVDGALMPGMATSTEITKLRSLSGQALDVFFLQLMIRHHQGGVPMARYAAEHARVGYVRDLATKAADAQSGEITRLELMLRQRGGTPLPPPA